MLSCIGASAKCWMLVIAGRTFLGPDGSHCLPPGL